MPSSVLWTHTKAGAPQKHPRPHTTPPWRLELQKHLVVKSCYCTWTVSNVQAYLQTVLTVPEQARFFFTQMALRGQCGMTYHRLLNLPHIVYQVAVTRPMKCWGTAGWGWSQDMCTDTLSNSLFFSTHNCQLPAILMEQENWVTRTERERERWKGLVNPFHFRRSLLPAG